MSNKRFLNPRNNLNKLKSRYEGINHFNNNYQRALNIVENNKNIYIENGLNPIFFSTEDPIEKINYYRLAERELGFVLARELNCLLSLDSFYRGSTLNNDIFNSEFIETHRNYEQNERLKEEERQAILKGNIVKE